MNPKTPISPPTLADRFLKWYCHEDLLDEIQGDLYEQFHKNISTKGPATARWKYTLDVVRFFRPSSFKSTQLSMNTQILSNYLKVAFRIFKKEKSYTFTNVLGLALGITCSLFIYLWVQDELKYNQWPTDADGIYYVLVNQIESSGTIHTWTTTPQPLRAVLEEKYPAIEKAAIINWGADLILRKNTDNLTLKGHYGSPELFDVFQIPFIQGSHELLYKQEESVVISEGAAIRYFGKDWKGQNVVGKHLTDKDNRQFTLAGVFQDIPKHSTISFEFIIPFDYLLRTQPWQTHWGNYNHSMYVKIADGYTTASANSNIEHAIRENREGMEGTAPLVLQPFKDLYLYSKYENGVNAGGRIEYVRLLSISAILILILAAVNFMNLTTARSAKRSKEAGIRKVMGAFRASLRTQFLLEAVLITALSFVVSALVVWMLLPYFNVLAGKEIEITFFTPQFVAICIGLILLIGILSGLYPAFYMSAINPVLSMKGILKVDRSNAFFRKGLVVFQFMITILMIAGSVTIYQQLQYIFTKNTGMDRENLIKTGLYNLSGQQLEIYLERLSQMPGVQAVTTTNNDPTNIGSSTSDPVWDGKDENTDIYFHTMGINTSFLPVMNIQLKEGRNFDPEIASDSINFIINETAARAMGMSEPIGQHLEFWDSKGTIIGVVKDFHIHSLHSPIKPLILYQETEPWMLLTKTRAGETQEAIASLEKLHTEFLPERAFIFSFLDDDFNNRYKSEQLVSKLTLYFTIVAIVISCIGLLSLVAFNTELKTKEIGIRKVLGASVPAILALIGREFIMLVLVAFILATPVAYIVMSKWLEQFAYRIDLGLGLFAIAGLATVAMSLATIGGHAVRSATRNPVDALRNE